MEKIDKIRIYHKPKRNLMSNLTKPTSIGDVITVAGIPMKVISINREAGFAGIEAIDKSEQATIRLDILQSFIK
jgi:hypothetical protein